MQLLPPLKPFQLLPLGAAYRPPALATPSPLRRLKISGLAPAIHRRACVTYQNRYDMGAFPVEVLDFDKSYATYCAPSYSAEISKTPESNQNCRCKDRSHQVTSQSPNLRLVVWALLSPATYKRLQGIRLEQTDERSVTM